MRVLCLAVLVALRVSSADESAPGTCAASDSCPDEVTLLQGARRVDIHQAAAEKAEEKVGSEEEKEAESEELSSFRRRRRNGDAQCRRRRCPPAGPVFGFVKTESSPAIYWEQGGKKHHVGSCNQCAGGADACSGYQPVSDSHMSDLTTSAAFQCFSNAPRFVKTASSPAIFWETGGTKKLVGSCSQCDGLSPCSDYQTVSDTFMNQLERDGNFNCGHAPRRFIKGPGAAVYWEHGGQRHHVPHCNMCGSPCDEYESVPQTYIDALPQVGTFSCGLLR